IWKDSRIMIRRAYPSEYEFSGGDDLSVHPDFALRDTIHPLQRRSITQDLLNRRLKERGFRLEQGKLFWILHETQNGIVDQVCRCLASREEEKLEETEDLVRRESLTVNLSLDETCQQIICWGGSFLLEQS